MQGFINFSLTHFTGYGPLISFVILAALILMVISWVLGVKCVTQKGKIFHFVEDFFYTEIDKKEYKNRQGNDKLDNDIILKVLPDNFRDTRNKYDAKRVALAIEVFMEENKEYSDDNSMTILNNLITNHPNRYWHYKKVRKFPDKLVDPVIGCATCMPSLHTALVYTLVCVLTGWYWNVFVWGFVAIASTYWTERLWRKRNIEEKTFKKL